MSARQRIFYTKGKRTRIARCAGQGPNHPTLLSVPCSSSSLCGVLHIDIGNRTARLGTANSTSFFPRLAHAAPVCPGLAQRASWELLLLPGESGQGWMKCLSKPPTLSLQGAAPTWRCVATAREREREVQRLTLRYHHGSRGPTSHHTSTVTTN